MATLVESLDLKDAIHVGHSTGIKAFSETDLKKFDVPTLIRHSGHDQIVPIGASAMLSSKLVKGAKLEVYKGAPHGMCTTLKEKVNADLLAFFKT
jgi:non-heme chloroperoxidase